MKAAIVPGPGAPAYYGEFDDPVAAGGRELVDLVAAGIHPLARSLAAGRHYGSTGHWPLIPGTDAVARAADGALIFTGFVEAPYGTLAERMAVPGKLRMELPHGSDPVSIAGGLNPGMASWMPLTARAAELGSLGAVLVLGVTGMAGLLAAQNAALLGTTRVIGAGRSPAGLERAAAAGAATVALTGDAGQDAVALAAALDGQAPGIVLDFLWASAAEAAFAALGRRGLSEDTADISYVQIGAMAGAEAAVPAQLLRSRRIRIAGSGAGSASMAGIIAQLPRYMELIATGKVRVPTQVFPLSEVTSAWAAAERGGPRAVVVPG